MSKMTLKQVHATLDEWGCSSLGQVQMSTELLRKLRDSVAARIAADEAAVPVAFALRHESDESGQLVALAFKKLGNGNGFTDVPLFTHPPAQPPIDIAQNAEAMEMASGLSADLTAMGQRAENAEKRLRALEMAMDEFNSFSVRHAKLRADEIMRGDG